MLFIPTLPVKVEFTAMLRILSNAKNAKQRLVDFKINLDKEMAGKTKLCQNWFLGLLPRPMAGS